ncbi:MAG: V-type ATPase subunit [Oscillospiraceae bacterium]
MNISSSAAIPAKIRTQFGKMLSKNDYDTLLRKKSVPEIAIFLKNQTEFSSILENIQEMLIHRGQLENILRKGIYNKYCSLLKYTDDKKDNFYFYYIIKAEINQILNFILYINAGTPEKIIIDLPMFLISKSTFKITNLGNVKNFSQLLSVLLKTPYYDILKDFENVNENNPNDYLSCEKKLMTYYYSKVLSMINKQFFGKEKKELCDVFLLEAELQNLSTIFRLKHFYGATSHDLEKYIIPLSYKIKKGQLNEIINAKTDEDLFNNIKKLNYARYGEINVEKHTFIENFVNNVEFHKLKRFMRFSIYPSVCLVSFICICNIEINNIITIIEAVRYNSPHDEIEKLLIT